MVDTVPLQHQRSKEKYVRADGERRRQLDLDDLVHVFAARSAELRAGGTLHHPSWARIFRSQGGGLMESRLET
jgi:hypothetical protein